MTKLTQDVFTSLRNQYTRYGDNYVTGSFRNKGNENLIGNIQLFPTKRTFDSFNKWREDYNYPSFMETHNENDPIYRLNNKGITRFMQQYFDKKFTILGVGAEFLEGVGNQNPQHMLRLVEVKDQNKNHYYLLLGGLAALENRSTQMNHSDQFKYGNDLLSLDSDSGALALDSEAFTAFVLSSANFYFSHKLEAKHIEAITEPMTVYLDNVNGTGNISEQQSLDKTNSLAFILKTNKK